MSCVVSVKLETYFPYDYEIKSAPHKKIYTVPQKGLFIESPYEIILDYHTWSYMKDV